MRAYPLTIYYDASCPMCNAEMHNLMLRNTRDLLRFVDASPADFRSPLPGVSRETLMTIIHATDAQGRVIQGVDVFRLAYEAVGMRWVSRMASLPVLGRLADLAYPWVARHRNRIPRAWVRWMFEGSARDAAEKAAARAHCTGNTCER